MKVGRFFGAVALLAILNCHEALAQTAPQLARDTTRPFAYIQFDHAGPRQPESSDEPPRGLWLRLVNNSVFPITVRVRNSGTDPDRTIVEDIIAPEVRRIPKSGPVDYGPMPKGYASAVDVVGSETVNPGKDLLFTVPVNHVAPGWFLEVPFQFDLPPAKGGAAQPVCYAAFTWEDIPEKSREPGPVSISPKPTTH
jgi:hypothetical protein